MNLLTSGFDDVLRLLPETVCVGVCRGDEWNILAHSAALKDFLYCCSEPGSGAGKKNPKQNLIDESLFSLLYRAGSTTAPDNIRASQPGQCLAIPLQNQGYAFVWSYLPVRKNAADKEKLRFFLLHNLPDALSYDDSNALQRELHIIINSMHDGIWVIDRNGTTVYVNKAMKRIANIDPQEMIGKHVSDPMKDGKFRSCVTLTALEQKKQVTMFDDYCCGTRCLNTSSPIFDENGEIWRVVASIRDMTELEDLQTRLADAERTAHIYKGKLDSMLQDHAAGFVANSKAMRTCLKELTKAARSPSGILLLGETGTGKTFASSFVHRKSPRADGPFISVNCAAIPDSLMESELFGYAKGAFTGAAPGGKKGCFELAHKGTLLLDEIGELTLPMQSKLLHVLDNQSFRRVGGEQTITVDVRVIAATNRSLKQLVDKGEFRADLYYRLRVLSVRLPPLREHPEDIPELAMTFLDEACKRYGMVKTLSPKLLKSFAAHSWPGNIRELRAAVEFLAAMSEGAIIRHKDLPPSLIGKHLPYDEDGEGEKEPPGTLKEAVDALEHSLISDALAKTGSSYKAAELLGISQSSVVRKARQLGIKLTVK